MAKVTMPQLGESVAEGTIGKWLKKPGDHVDKYEPLLEVITDKVNAEVPSPFAGTLKEILVEEGATVPNNAEIAVIDEDGGAAQAPEASASTASAEAAPAAAAPAAPAPAMGPAGSDERTIEEMQAAAPTAQAAAPPPAATAAPQGAPATPAAPTPGPPPPAVPRRPCSRRPRGGLSGHAPHPRLRDG